MDAAVVESERQLARTACPSFVALALIFEKYAVFNGRLRRFSLFLFLPSN